jgi:hypothetical protein
MSKGSSALPQTVAALHQYGLLAEYGWGDSGRIALSDLAIRIITNPSEPSSERMAAVKEAALKPTIFAEIWEVVQRVGHADHAALTRLLTMDREARGRAPFTRKAADEVLRLFTETVAYAGLAANDAYGERIEAFETRNSADQSFLSEPRFPNVGALRHLIAPSSRFGPRAPPEEGWTEEPLTDEVGDLILIQYRGKPSRKRYEFIRDYLDLKIKRLERDS